MINAQEFFTHAMHDSEAVTALLANDGGDPNIFEYPCEEELGDNPGKPYIVVQNTGTIKAQGSKDDAFDTEEDITTIEVVCVTSSKEDAKAVAMASRKALRDAMNDMTSADVAFFDFAIQGVAYSDKGVQYDPESGNYFVALTYQIEAI